MEKFLFAHPIEFARPIYFYKLAFKFQENIMILLAPIYFYPSHLCLNVLLNLACTWTF